MSGQRRPGQATFAVWLIVCGSVLAVVTAWERIADLHTVPAQDALREALRNGPLDTGMGVQTLSDVVHVLCVVGGGAATAAALLGVQALRRSIAARTALTALAPLVFAGWLGTQGWFEPFVLAGIAMLWLPPTRDWYAGRQPVERTGSRRVASLPTQHPFQAPRAPAQGPPAQHDPTQPPPPDPSTWSGAAYPPVGYDGRPPALVWACALTWVFCGLGTVMLTLSVIVLQTMTDRELHHAVAQVGTLPAGVTLHELRSAVTVMCAIAVPVCLAAIVLAALAFRGRHPWARTALSVVSGLAGTACVLLALSNPVLLLPGGAAIATTVLLARREVATWRPGG